MKYKASEIERVYVNGKEKKVFDLLEDKGDHWLFCGKYSAPADAKESELVGYALDTAEAEQV